MRRPLLLCLLLGLLLCLPGSASAKKRPPTYVPPGQSAAAQYTEDVPTAGGARPTSSLHRPAGSTHRHGRGHTRSAVSSATVRQLSRAGAAGAAAAALATSMAPTSDGAPAATPAPAASSAGAPATAHRGAHGRRGAAHPGAGTPRPTRTGSTNVAVPGTATGTPAAQVFKTLTGSGSDGLGPLLPIVLIVSLVGATALGLLRLRRS